MWAFAIGCLSGAVAMFVVMVVSGVFIGILAFTDDVLSVWWDKVSRSRLTHGTKSPTVTRVGGDFHDGGST